MATFTELVASLDPDPLKRGKQFEVFIKWFLKTDPEWATQVDQVWLWEEYPDRWGVDCGIDLVFRHRNGETWAAQAKCYSSQHDITKHDVDKFLSESNRKGIDKRLLIATTDRIGANARQVCDAQEKTVVRYLLSNFEGADVEYPATFADLHTAKRKAKPLPRNHQVEAIDAVGMNFQGSDRGQLIMACGTGKTFTTLWIKENLDSNSTLVLLPSLGLLSQTLHEWTLAANQPFDVLCVCSDETVGKRGGDEAIHSVTDLAFPVTSDTNEINAFLKRDGARVVFSTYQSSPLIADAQTDGSTPTFDLVIADEAHRCAGKVGSDFSTVLDSKRIRATKRLFTTATPRTYSTSVKKAAGERGIEVVGMDDEAVFGKVLFSLPFGEAIRRGLLTDYQVVIIGVDNPTIAQWIQNRELIKTESGIENDAESLAAQIGVLKAFKDFDLKRVISFHGRVARAESFTLDIQQVAQWIGQEHRPSGTLKTDYVSGAMPTDKRRRKLSQLKALGPLERGLLANARCLSEGVDVPSLDGVAFIDPRSSQIDIIQAVGRAIRLSPNKKAGTIVVPVFIEDSDSPEESIEASNFKPIWDVLNALKAHDDVLSAEMDQLRTEMGRKSGSKVGAFSKIQIDLPTSVDQAFGECLRTYLVKQVTAAWEFWYGLLQSYAAEHDDCRVPQRFNTIDGYRLGVWVSVQRRGREDFPKARREKLEALSGWSWEILDEQWETGFCQLQEYVKTHGNCLVPFLWKSSDGFSLGGWVASQRIKSKLLADERRVRLEAMPGWTWNVADQKWNEAFSYLQNYTETNGSSLVPIKLTLANGFRLGSWVARVRRFRERLSAEQIANLESLLGWTWTPNADQWETGFQCLREYAETHKNCWVPSDFTLPNGYPLGNWVGYQRIRRLKLSSEYLDRLESLAGWAWHKPEAQWEYGFQCLADYTLEHGNCLISTEFVLPSGYKLGAWVSDQRSRGNRRTPEQKARLEAIPGWTWNRRTYQWEEGFKHLVDYAAEHGDCLVPVTFKTPGKYCLGIWLTTQRVHRAKLSEDQRNRLESIEGWSWDPISDLWLFHLRHLQSYASANGHCSPPSSFIALDGCRLGNWVNFQRAMKSRMKLSAERITALEALPGWTWDPRGGQFKAGMDHLLEFVAAEGHSLVPQDYQSIDGFKLGTWVQNRRRHYKNNDLAQSHVAELNEIDGWVWKVR